MECSDEYKYWLPEPHPVLVSNPFIILKLFILHFSTLFCVHIISPMEIYRNPSMHLN